MKPAKKNTGDWIWDLTLAAKKYRAWETFLLEGKCPGCGSKEIEKTAIGCLGRGPDTSNRASCAKCGCRTVKGDQVHSWLKDALAKVPPATTEPDPP